MDKYIERFGGIVKIERSKERLGLIRAKLLGGKVAVGEIIVFLDSHCEVNQGWLVLCILHVKKILCLIRSFQINGRLIY